MTIKNIDALEYMSTIPSNYYDCVITDPPYDFEDFAESKIFNEIIRVCNGNIVMFCKPENQYFKPDEYAFWIKPPSPKANSRNLSRMVEMILVLRRSETFNAMQFHWRNRANWWNDVLLEKQIHEYQKPVSLMQRLIEIYSKPNGVIFDPFAGSGTTIIAAANTGRMCHGCEKDLSAYVAASRRIEQYCNAHKTLSITASMSNPTSPDRQVCQIHGLKLANGYCPSLTCIYSPPR